MWIWCENVNAAGFLFFEKEADWQKVCSGLLRILCANSNAASLRRLCDRIQESQTSQEEQSGLRCGPRSSPYPLIDIWVWDFAYPAYMDFTTAAPQHFNGQDKFGATFCGCCASPCFFRWWPEGLSHSWLWSSGNEKNHLQVWKEHIQGLGYSVCADQKNLIKLLSVTLGTVTGWTYTLYVYISHTCEYLKGIFSS